ncbi:cysteine peptidase family C39 domain-containing protein [Hahella sp. HN01]|uniref:cysteine peptidase family C39 domain-containing protein n=1 Tax=unclassified Hahella TaxID=2624107 RepID=UPI0020A67CA2|nr:cysteine peptidase family C39 domain-containing protein [Hahella sp. HN01]
MSETNSTGRLDTGLAALVMLARFHQVAADPAQIQHHFGTHENAFTEQAQRYKAMAAAGAERRACHA